MNKKKFIIFLKKNYSKARIISVLIGTLIMFYGFYFSNKSFTLETLQNEITKPIMYICILFSFISSLLIHYIIGDFNKKNIKKIKNLEE